MMYPKLSFYLSADPKTQAESLKQGHPDKRPRTCGFSTKILLLVAMGVVWQTFLSAQSASPSSNNYELTCDGMVVHFNSFSSWPSTYWDFGDGTPIVQVPGHNADHVYVNANPFDHPITARFSLDQSTWFEDVVDFPGVVIGGGCGSNRLASELHNEDIFPANGLNSRNIYIYGDLEIDIPYSFTDCNVYVMTGGKIKVINHGDLNLAGTKVDRLEISGSCNDMWGGIEVHSGGKFTGLDQSTIQNAYFGIRPIHSPGTASAPQINLSKVAFKRNFIGICANSGPVAFGTFSGNSFEGSGNNPILDIGSCSPPQAINGVPFTNRTYCGIYVADIKGGLSLPGNQAAPNKFTDLQAGVVIVDADAKIQNCTFKNIAIIAGNNASYQGNAITFWDNFGNRNLEVYGLGKEVEVAPTIEECVTGIFAQSRGGFTTTLVENCKMDMIQNGIVFREISIGNFSSIHIENNDITCNKVDLNSPITTASAIDLVDSNPWFTSVVIQHNTVVIDEPAALTSAVLKPVAIRITSFSQQSGFPLSLKVFNNDFSMHHAEFGIELTNISHAEIENNNIYTFDEVFPLIAIDLTGGGYNKIQCNTISGTGPVLYSLGIRTRMSVNTDFSGNTLRNLLSGISIFNYNGTDCNLGGNNFDSNIPGIYGLYYNDALTGPQYLNANKWVAEFDFAAEFDAGLSDFPYCLSRYHVSEDANIEGTSPNMAFVSQVEPCGDWFTLLPNTVEPNYSCAQPSPPGIPERNEADSYLAISNNRSSLSPGMQWAVEMGLYQKFTELPELVNGDADISTFLSGQAGNPIALTYDVRNDFVNLYKNPSLETQLQNLQTQATGLRSDMDNLLPDVGTDPAAWASWTSLHDQLDELNQEMASLLEQWEADIRSSAQTVQSSNNAFTCNGLPCSNEQYLHNLFLETRIVAPREIDETELAQLKSMAKECPSVGGPAVFLARGWYYWLTGVVLQDSCGSGLPAIESVLERRSGSTSLPVAALNLQPNPAGEYVQVEIPVAGSSPSVLLIRNAFGVLLRQVPVERDQVSIRIPLSDIPSGFYGLVLTNTSGAPISSAKLIVTH